MNGALESHKTSTRVHVFSLEEKNWLKSFENTVPHAKAVLHVFHKGVLKSIWPERNVKTDMETVGAGLQHSYTQGMFQALRVPEHDFVKFFLQE